MPRMPFIGVRISWLMAARKRDLARLAASACLRASRSSASVRRRSVMSRPEALHLGDGGLAGRYGVLLPLEPARARARSRSPARSAAGAASPPGASGRRLVAGEHAGREGAPEHGAALEAEHPAEGLVDEGQAALRVAAQDDVGLVVQQIAVAGLVLADLPLDVLERLEPPLEALADRA